ncbi:ribonuclease H-like domain-containing protein, partial [Mycena polygramma]
LLRETIASKKSAADKQATFYGPVFDAAGRTGIQVYTDGSCFDNGSPTARAGAGAYFGPGSELNHSLRVSGDQTNNRGELLAILYALYSVPPEKSISIYSDSEYSIRSIVYWAPDRADKGWKCANADILQDIVSWIRYRSAPVQFHHVKAHTGNSHNDAADAAAKEGA